MPLKKVDAEPQAEEYIKRSRSQMLRDKLGANRRKYAMIIGVISIIVIIVGSAIVTHLRGIW